MSNLSHYFNTKSWNRRQILTWGLTGLGVTATAALLNSRFKGSSQVQIPHIADQMQQNFSEDHQVIVETMAELKAALPSVTPPETPVKMPSEVQGLVYKIELYSSRVASSPSPDS